MDIMKQRTNMMIKDNRGQDDRKELGLYFHIPFCLKKCDYCDFLSAPASEETIDRYIEAMLNELEQYDGCTSNYIVPTIFFGGGTPSSIDALYIEKLLEATGRIFGIDRKQLEATIEINPATLTADKLISYQRAGINRLSFGLQSTDNQELKRLGRIHTYEQFEENYRLARGFGFNNINIDLMSAIPGQTVASWENTLRKVTALNPEHISAYSLILEEGTAFYDRYREGSEGFAQLPDEEADRVMYHRTKDILRECGYQRYEISNYAKEGYECRHNSSYWIGTDYLGIGLGAASLMDGVRFSNVRDLSRYLDLCNRFKKNAKSNLPENTRQTDYSHTDQNTIQCDSIGIREDIVHLTKHQQMEEFMFLGLRLTSGISKVSFAKRFGIDINEIYGAVLKDQQGKGLLEYSDDRIKLTEYGIDISNYVLSEFLLD